MRAVVRSWKTRCFLATLSTNEQGHFYVKGGVCCWGNWWKWRHLLTGRHFNYNLVAEQELSFMQNTQVPTTKSPDSARSWRRPLCCCAACRERIRWPELRAHFSDIKFVSTLLKSINHQAAAFHEPAFALNPRSPVHYYLKSSLSCFCIAPAPIWQHVCVHEVTSNLVVPALLLYNIAGFAFTYTTSLSVAFYAIELSVVTLEVLY